MFDVGFNELLLIAVIGLLVLGPERLPKVAAQIGRWVARARRTANQLRLELEREIALSEIAKAEKRGKEQGQASSDDEDAEHEAAASGGQADDYEADLYTTTHEGLGAQSGAQPSGYDGPEHSAPEPAGNEHEAPTPEDAESEHSQGEPESGEEAAPQPGRGTEPQRPPPQQQPETEAPAEAEHAPAARGAGKQPPESTDKTASR